MKVLYVGNYRDASGWGTVAEANMLAMHEAGIEVVARPISFGPQKTVHPVIESMEQKICKGSDICVQHCLPTHYYYNSKMKNIGFYCTETTDFYYSHWYKYINMMDMAWVMSEENVKSSKRSQVNIPIEVIPFSIDPSKYNRKNRTASIAELDQGFNFCFVGEWNNRKNLISLLKAFYSEFHPSEPVNLFVKLSSNMPSDRCLEEFNKLNDHVKSGLKIRKKYQNISVVCGQMNHDDYISVLSQCHTFVCPSYGEACCIPAVEAMALGLNVIYTNEIGLNQYVKAGISVLSREEYCFGMQSALPEIQTANESWMAIDQSHLRWTMRSCYEYYDHSDEARNKISQDTFDSFSHKAVGKIIKEKLSWI
jgi:glycosyltransferase involved in cell wall biosynthesis